VLALNANEDCPICLDVLKSPAVTPCAHVFCKACIEQVIKVAARLICVLPCAKLPPSRLSCGRLVGCAHQQQPSCPMCRQVIESKDLVEAPPIEEDEDDDGGAAGPADGKLLVDPEEVRARAVPHECAGVAKNSGLPKPRHRPRCGLLQVVNPSSKIIALLEYLEAAKKKDPTIKSVVFSQWTRMLDLIEVRPREHGVAATPAGSLMRRVDSRGRSAFLPVRASLGRLRHVPPGRRHGPQAARPRHRVRGPTARRGVAPSCADVGVQVRWWPPAIASVQNAGDGSQRHGYAGLADLRQPGPEPCRR